MQEGAFALIDCLGFKGIWKRTDPSTLIQKLTKIEEIVQREIISTAVIGGAQKYLSFGPTNVNVRLLSDTVAISVQYEEQGETLPQENQKNYLVGLICHVVVHVLDMFLKGEPALVLRGCISYGEHLCESNFIAGPAVDDAAEQMNIAEGAFVWLLPSAESRYRDLISRMASLLQITDSILFVESLSELKNRGFKIQWALDAVEEYGQEAVTSTLLNVFNYVNTIPIVISPYEMPLKTGARLRCAVINPLIFQKSEEERRLTIETYSKVISGNRLDIWLKHQHTIDYLEVADKVCTSFREKLVDFGVPEAGENDESF